MKTECTARKSWHENSEVTRSFLHRIWGTIVSSQLASITFEMHPSWTQLERRTRRFVGDSHKKMDCYYGRLRDWRLQVVGYSCPHCFEPKVTMFIKSLQKHVEQCQQLPVAVRQQQAAQWQRAIDRSQVVTQRVRLYSKRKVAPGVFPIPEAAAVAPKAAPKAAPQPGAAKASARRKHRRSDDWDPAAVRANYQRRFPHRQMTLADLPAPAPPEGWDPTVCFAVGISSLLPWKKLVGFATHLQILVDVFATRQIWRSVNSLLKLCLAV